MKLERCLGRMAMMWAGGLYRRLPADLRQVVGPYLRPFYHRRMAAQITRAASHEGIEFSLPWGVGVYGYFTSESGVGEGARRSAAALTDAGVPVAAINVEMGVHVNRETCNALPLLRDNPYAVNLIHINADQIGRLHELIGAGNHAGRYTIGYWAWEMAEFPDALVPAFEAVHEVWVPSTFVARAVAAKTGKPVLVMPHPIAVQPPAVASRSKFGLPENSLVFLCAVDFNSYGERKNVIGAVKAFKLAFPSDTPNVHLVIKAHSGTNALQTPRKRLREAVAGDSRITVIDRVMLRSEVTELQAAADVFVSLHRAEGFGLPIAECMALGKSVIATDYSGSTDFVTPDCALPVPYRLIEVGDRAYPFGKGQYWADPDLEAAAGLMRTVAGDAELRARLGLAAQGTIRERYSEQVIGARMAARLDEIRALLEGS